MRRIFVYTCSDRVALASLYNSWLYEDEINHARKVASDGSDEECARLLDDLDARCVSRLDEWRSFQ